MNKYILRFCINQGKVVQNLKKLSADVSWRDVKISILKYAKTLEFFF